MVQRKPQQPLVSSKQQLQHRSRRALGGASARLAAMRPRLKGSARSGAIPEPHRPPTVEGEPLGGEERNASSADPLDRPLLHVPIYCGPNVSAGERTYMVELLLACLDSYFHHGNDDDLLVSTNDHETHALVNRYQERTGRAFDLMHVSRRELVATFKTSVHRLDDAPSSRVLVPKFYPILKRLRTRIVHLDFDTLFLAKADTPRLFASDVNLLDANDFEGCRPWRPNRGQARFFRIDPLPVVPDWNWINSGVFSVQGSGFDILRDEIAHYFGHLRRAIELQINALGDEGLMNALAIRHHGRVHVIRDHTHNFLAYHLRHVPRWRSTAKILHFHAVKPHVFEYADGKLQHRADAAGRISQAFYSASLTWCRHLHAACGDLGIELPMTRRMPLAWVEKEHERLVHSKATSRTISDELGAST